MVQCGTKVKQFLMFLRVCEFKGGDSCSDFGPEPRSERCAACLARSTLLCRRFATATDSPFCLFTGLIKIEPWLFKGFGWKMLDTSKEQKMEKMLFGVFLFFSSKAEEMKRTHTIMRKKH